MNNVFSLYLGRFFPPSSRTPSWQHASLPRLWAHGVFLISLSCRKQLFRQHTLFFSNFTLLTFLAGILYSSGGVVAPRFFILPEVCVSIFRLKTLSPLQVFTDWLQRERPLQFALRGFLRVTQSFAIDTYPLTLHLIPSLIVFRLYASSLFHQARPGAESARPHTHCWFC